jgi:hypothetical protein
VNDFRKARATRQKAPKAGPVPPSPTPTPNGHTPGGVIHAS